MLRNSKITAAVLIAVLALAVPHPLSAATDNEATKKSSASGKKKSTTSSTGKKKAVTTDDDSAPASSSTKKGSGTSLDLPLPARVPAAGESSASSEKKDLSGEKKGSAPEKDGESGGKSGSAAEKKNGDSEKSAATPEKKHGDNPPSEDKASEKTGADSAAKREHAPNATVEPEAIAEFATQPPRIQQMIRDAVDLTRLNLTYTFGSANPDSGGMDCSGTIYYLLHAHGFNDVPRDSSGQYMWSRKSGAFYPVVSKNAESAEFSELRPGDLMFWTGTYDTQRDIPISHVMLYLGREKATGKRIMFGASDGRSYNGIQRWGVSVFDFKMPKADPASPEKAKVDFVGYARIPGLRSGATSPAETVAAAAADEAVKSSAKPAASDEGVKSRSKSTASEEETKPPAKSATASTRKKKGATRKSE